MENIKETKADLPQPPSAIASYEDAKVEHPISGALSTFLRRLKDLRDAATIAGPAVGKWRHDSMVKVGRNLEKFIQKQGTPSQTHALAQGAHAASDMLKSAQEFDRLKHSKAFSVLMRSLFIGIFSEYDVFIGDLLRAIHDTKPELFKGIKREITLSELLEFESVDAVKQDILDKEIDSFRRQSYVEQFTELESKFAVKTLRSFPEWPAFVELGQRRNLLTHNGGLCSEQYLVMCDKAGYKFSERPKTGDDLMPQGKYFGEALLLTAKVAFMLTHTLWRKILPDEISIADRSMNLIIFELLSDERWRHASEFGKFGLTDPMFLKAKDLDKRIRLINTAIGLKQCKKTDEALTLLDSMDWTASLRDFQLALYVLRDQNDAAAALMESIGQRGELIDQMGYHSWPLFKDFRDTVNFQDAYERVYKIPFIVEATKEAQAKVDSSVVTPEINTAIGEIAQKKPLRRKKVSIKQIVVANSDHTSTKPVAKTRARSRSMKTKAAN
jgi:hypothetical protein